MNQQELKQKAALAALEHIPNNSLIGVGTGSTVNCFIDALIESGKIVKAAVSSSDETSRRLQAARISVIDLDDVDTLPVYIDGADEINHQLQMIKGGGGALTREKIVASVAQRFICIADASKYVSQLGQFPLPIEVIPMAIAPLKKRLKQYGASAILRDGFTTDNGQAILDVTGLDLSSPEEVESMLNQWPGVVTNGLFALKTADMAIICHPNGSIEHYYSQS